MLEIRFGAGGEVPCPRATRAFEDSVATSVAAEDGEGLEHQLRPLVARGSRRATTQSPASAGAAGDSRRRRGCGRRPRSRAAPRRAARAGPGARRPRRHAGRPRAPRKASAAATASARLLEPATTTSAAPFARASGSHSCWPSDDERAGRARRRASRRRSPRACRRGRRCARARRSSARRRACEDVRRVVAAAETRFDDGDVDLGLGELERAPQPSAISNCVAPSRVAASRTRATARSKSASPFRTRMRSLQPRTCGEKYAPTREPGVREERLRQACRRRLAVRADDVDRRIPLLRVAELCEQRVHALRPEAVRRPRARAPRATQLRIASSSRR